MPTPKGGYTVPDFVASEILGLRTSIGVTRRVARVVPMVGEVVNWPKRLTGQTVYYPGEATAITTNEQTWGTVALTAVKRGVLTKISSELLRSSAVAIANVVTEEIGYALAAREDVEFINGDDGAGYGGVSGLVDAIGTAGDVVQGTGNTWAAIVLDDFAAVQALLPEQYHAGAKFICSRAFFHTVIESLVNASGGTTAAELGNATARQLNGYPIEFTDQMPTATGVAEQPCYFGNFMEACLVGDRAGVQLASSEHRYFDEDVIALRGVVSYDIQVHEPGDGSNPGAYVALQTGA